MICDFSLYIFYIVYVNKVSVFCTTELDNFHLNAIDADSSHIAILTFPQNAFQNQSPEWVDIEGHQFWCVFLKNEVYHFHEFTQPVC